jgi:hypothetical protein
MAKRYSNSFEEGIADDRGKKQKRFTSQSTQYAEPEADPLPENVSDSIFNFHPPIDPQGMNETRPRFATHLGEGFLNVKDAAYDKLSEEVTFLTSLVLETKHSQNSMNKRFVNEREFKHKGNKSQDLVLANALHCREEAMYALSNNNIQNAEAHLIQQESILLTRKSMVNIADTSEFGWETVTAYESLFLQGGVDNATNVKRAEDMVRASKKTKVETVTKTRGRGRGRGRGQNQRGAHNSAETGQVYYDENDQGYGYCNAPDNYNYPPPPPYPGHYAAPYPPYRPPNSPMKCYNCNGFGHTSKKCPSMQGVYTAENHQKQ